LGKISPHCLITPNDISSNNNVTVNDNSKLTIKLNENTENTRFNNVEFSSAFPDIASKSGSLILNTQSGRKINAVAGDFTDELKNDVNVNDSISFDSPWLLLDKNEDTIIDARRWKCVSISDNIGGNIKQSAVAFDDYIYISLDTGGTWVRKESRRNWVSVSVTSDFTVQSAAVRGGQLYISIDSGNTWKPKEFFRNWIDVAISRTNGQYQIAAVANGNIYVSSDTGVSWTVKPFIKNWKSVSISTDGSKQTAVSFGGNIYVSVDFGVSWTSKSVVKLWQSVDMNNTGDLQVACTYNGEIYRSVDSGNNWGNIAPGIPEAVLTSISISPTATVANVNTSNIVISSTKDIFSTNDGGITWSGFGYDESWTSVSASGNVNKHTAVVDSGGIYNGTNFGTVWSDLKGYNTWQHIAVSSSGEIQYAVNEDLRIYKSNNSGNTWALLNTSGGGGGINVSDNGKIVVAVSGTQIRISNDSGATFIDHVAPGICSRPGVSSTGQYISIPIFGSQIYTSETFGSNAGWNLRGPIHNWGEVAVSSSGLIQIAVADSKAFVTANAWVDGGNDTNQNIPMTNCAISNTGQYAIMSGVGSVLSISNDFGTSWIQHPSRNYKGVKMSSSGQIQLASVFNGNLYVSTDFGVTFNTKDISREWGGVDMSADGIKHTAVVNGGYIYQTTNTGDMWNKKQLSYSNPFIPLKIRTVAISSTGQYVTYAATGDFIYTSNNFGKTYVARYPIIVGEPLQRLYIDLAMSDSGDIQVAIATGGVFSGGVYVSTDYGVTWILRESSSQYRKVGMNSTGSIINIVGDGVSVKISSDNGATFVDDVFNAGKINDGSRSWSGITMSADGSIRYASSFNDGIWKFAAAEWNVILSSVNAYSIESRDNIVNDGSLVTYVTTDNIIKYNSNALVGEPNTATTSKANDDETLVRIRMGPSDKQTILLSNTILTTTDNWATQTQKNGNRSWKGLDMTLDGTQLIACVSPGYIYRSFDSSETWGTNQVRRNPSTISMSGTSTIQLVGSSGNELYTSSNTGNTWTTAGISNNWRQVAISGNDGSVQVAIPYRGKIYTSSDSGGSWIQRDSVRNWRGVTMNTTGNTIFAADYGGHIYKSNGNLAIWTTTSDQGISPPNTQNWISISVSGDGAAIIAAVENGTIYKSANTGGSWTITQNVNNTNMDSLNWKSVKVSNNAAIYVGVVYGGKIYVSINQLNWIAKDSDRDWFDIAISDNGAVQTAVVYNGQIYVSTNSGSSWSARGDVKAWVSVDVNTDGSVQTAVVENGEIYKSIDSGVTWFTQPELKEITSIEMSNTGVVQTISEAYGNIYFSINSGSSWLQTGESRNWKSITMTPDGALHTAVEYGGTIYRATNNNGTLTTWSPITGGIGNNTARNYTSISMNTTGLVRVAIVDGGSIHRSIDNGDTWADIAATGSFNWQGVAITEPLTVNDNATFTIYAVARGKNIFRSINSGIAWAEVSTGLILNWSDIAVSINGTHITAAVQGGQLYSSNDSGVTWTARDSNRNWVKIDMSDDGTKQIAIVDGGQIYSSTDSGVTWKVSESSRSWCGISINSDGTLQMASTKTKILLHPFDLNKRLTLTVESVNSGIINSFTSSEIADASTMTLHGYNLTDSMNFTTIRKEVSTPKDIFIPAANYTPSTLVTSINAKLAETNTAFVSAFTYNQATRKMSFTSPFSGSGLISSTNLLKRIGFTELTSSSILTAGSAVTADSIVNTDISGPLNIFIKSEIIGDLRKNITAFSTNSKLKNLIAPLDLDETSNSYKITFPVEMFLSKKSDISSIDIQISDEEGNIVNLNNATVQVNFYFYSS
jgi:hypothetical protein